MLRCMGLVWCLGAVAAQGHSVEDLLSKDWQVRNAAALGLETTFSEEIGENTISDVAWEAREVLRAHR